VSPIKDDVLLTPFKILVLYGYSENDAGICAAILIVVGLIAAAISSPLTDRSHSFVLMIRIFVPLIAAGYIGFIWTPNPAHTLGPPYAVGAILGACSFSLLPVALEYVVEITHPVSPEITSTICWAGGQALGIVFILIMQALKAPKSGHPPENMKR